MVSSQIICMIILINGRKKKSKYRPISILSIVSKVYNRRLDDQLYDIFENKFSRYQCGFREGFIIQNALLTMVKKMLLSRDKKDVCGAILTDLPKAFDSISHGQLITKLNAFEFDWNALKVIHDYLFKRSQKTKVGSLFNDSLNMWCSPRYMVLPMIDIGTHSF